MNNQFDWHLIRAFLAALDAGSLLGAAKKLQTTQPTVGRQVAQLEAQMGVVLFERTGRGLQPTATALSLADAARSMESGALQLARQLQAKQTQVQGTVRITASQPVAYQLLPPILASMRDALPEIQVELISSNQVSNLLRREADIAVRMVQPDQGTLIAKKLGSVSVGVYAHKSYLARFGTPQAPDDLLKHTLIGYDSDDVMIRGFANYGQSLGKEAFAIRSDDLIVQWQALCAACGIGFVADYMGRSQSDLVKILPMLKIPPLPMWLAVHREIRSNQRIRAVFDYLAKALPPLL
ncbi:MAG TPA: LysR family transcriptional regulator [Burkholderiaceae bacterium]|nr:LysR family transcriptional regulator [Burkholderiaceae bacterium]